ncbi:MAG: DUF1178 family protein [Burkholderiales bacterium]|nr:DUF1178 family protein [Burkholderiales bacterium]
MIVYDLICDDEHRFEAWFASSDDFERQAGTPLLTCPVCGASAVRRAPAGLHVARHRRGQADVQATAEHVAAFPSTDELWNVLRQVVDAAENVGPRFAEEARRMHYGEAPKRSIRGQATPEDAEALEEEGIDVLRLPVPPSDDLN